MYIFLNTILPHFHYKSPAVSLFVPALLNGGQLSLSLKFKFLKTKFKQDLKQIHKQRFTLNV